VLALAKRSTLYEQPYALQYAGSRQANFLEYAVKRKPNFGEFSFHALGCIRVARHPSVELWLMAQFPKDANNVVLAKCGGRKEVRAWLASLA
jgi:hypothetical protein